VRSEMCQEKRSREPMTPRVRQRKRFWSFYSLVQGQTPATDIYTSFPAQDMASEDPERLFLRISGEMFGCCCCCFIVVVVWSSDFIYCSPMYWYLFCIIHTARVLVFCFLFSSSSYIWLRKTRHSMSVIVGCIGSSRSRRRSIYFTFWSVRSGDNWTLTARKVSRQRSNCTLVLPCTCASFV